jgi:hypothetical protein
MSSAGANVNFPLGWAQSQNLVSCLLSFFFNEPKQGFGGLSKLAISFGLST